MKGLAGRGVACSCFAGSAKRFLLGIRDDLFRLLKGLGVRIWGFGFGFWGLGLRFDLFKP